MDPSHRTGRGRRFGIGGFQLSCNPDRRAREQLHRWMLSLPWVIERPGMVTAPGLRWFAVECRPLAIRRVWALTGALDNRGSVWDVHLVLPRAPTTSVLVFAEAELTDPITASHWLVTIPAGPPRRPAQQLEQLLRVAYAAALS
jgi:hypothetical protein